MNRVRLTSLSLVGVAALLAAACGAAATPAPAAQQSAGAPSPTAGQSGEAQVTLTVLWYVNSDQETAVVNQLLSQYSREHPGVSFNLQIVSYENYDAKLAQLVAAGTPPDVAKSTSMRPEIQPFLVNLADYYGPDWINGFVKSFAAGAVLNGKVIAAPLDVTATGIFLNKSAFDKAGVPIPSEEQGWTYSQFLPAIKEVAEKAQIRYPLVWDVTAGRWITYLYHNGQHVFSEAPPYKVTLDPNALASVIESFLAMANEYMPPGLWTGSSSDNPKQLFLSGQAVAWMSGSWQIQSLVSGASFAWQAGPTPYVTTRSSVVGGDYVLAFANGHHVPQAVEFIKWLTGPQVEAQYAKGTMYIPASTAAGAIDYGNPMASQAMNALQYELANSPVYAGSDSGNLAMQYVWDPIKENITKAASKAITPQQAANAIVSAAQTGLAQTYPAK
jgi:alpha-1,4-digalacturonate transport system substrate-binding protein